MKEFCAKFNNLYVVLAVEPAPTVRELKAWATDIGASGTPNEMNDDARKGFAVVLAMFQGLDADATAEEIKNVGSDASAEDNRIVKAFGQWSYQNCSSAGTPPAG